MNLTSPKVMTLSKALRWRRQLTRDRGRLVLTNGVFDLLHPGHTSYLAKARALAGKKGKLFVALNSDKSVRALKGAGRPILSERARAFNLAQLQSVDGVIIFRSKRLDREIRKLKPDVYCKAGDYTAAKLDPKERAALDAVRARKVFLPFLAGFSTTRLIARLRAAGEC